MLHATAPYAALLALGFVYLTVRVGQQRGRAKETLGAIDPSLQRATRAHGNFAEYVPLALILMAIAELNGLPAWAIHTLGLMLVIGRISHAWGISQHPEPMIGRGLGTGLTLGVLILAAIANLIPA